MRASKKISIIIIAILIAICVFIDVWFVYVVLYGKEKQIVNTYEVGLQTLADGSDTKYFVELNYFSNENKNGYECFEIKFNYLLDENKNAFYSQGIQYVANSKEDKISLELKNVEIDSQHHWAPLGNYYNRNLFYSYDVGETTSYFNYASADDYQTVSKSTNPLGENSYFRIQLGDAEDKSNLFLMQFKSSLRTDRAPEEYSKTLHKDADYFSPAIYCWYKDSDYLLYDYTYFSQILYSALSDNTIANGTKSAMLFEFGNLFDYYQYNDQGNYENTVVEDSTKVISKLTSYYSILVNKSADGIQKANQSLFNCVHGNSNFNLSYDYSDDDYFIGRTIVNCDIYDFEYTNISSNYYQLKLKQSFINEYEKHRDSIVLNVEINLDDLEQKNLKFYGFAENSGLKNFEIFDCYTLQTSNGETVKTEVAYV